MSWVTMIAVRSAQHAPQHPPDAPGPPRCRGPPGARRAAAAWVRRERPGDGDPLRLAAGQLRRASARRKLDRIHLAQPLRAAISCACGFASGPCCVAPNATLSSTLRCGKSSGVLREQRAPRGVRRSPEPRAGAEVEQRRPVEDPHARSRGAPAPRRSFSSVDLPAPLGRGRRRSRPVSMRRSTAKPRRRLRPRRSSVMRARSVRASSRCRLGGPGRRRRRRRRSARATARPPRPGRSPRCR